LAGRRARKVDASSAGRPVTLSSTRRGRRFVREGDHLITSLASAAPLAARGTLDWATSRAASVELSPVTSRPRCSRCWPGHAGTRHRSAEDLLCDQLGGASQLYDIIVQRWSASRQPTRGGNTCAQGSCFAKSANLAFARVICLALRVGARSGGVVRPKLLERARPAARNWYSGRDGGFAVDWGAASSPRCPTWPRGRARLVRSRERGWPPTGTSGGDSTGPC